MFRSRLIKPTVLKLHVFYSLQLAKQEQGHATSNLSQNTLRSRIAEVEGRLSGVESENTQLRRDKMLLVDHVSELQKQVRKQNGLEMIGKSGKIRDKQPTTCQGLFWAIIFLII